MDEQRDVLVVGGGIAGLTAAATVAAAGRSVLVLDGRPGANRASTDEVGGYRFNRGAHALYRTGAGRAVLDRLGVRVTGGQAPTAGLGRRGDRVDVLPAGPASLARTSLLSRREKLRLARLLAGMGRWRPDELADRTAAAWFDDLGLAGGVREMAELLTRTTTFVTDLDCVSADLVAGQMRMGLRGGVDYLDGGWASLLSGLRSVGARHGVEMAPEAATAVTPDGGRVRVTTTGGRGPDGADGAGPGRTVLARTVIVAAGSPEACAALLPARPAGWDDLGPAAEVACLDLGLPSVPETSVLFGVDRPLYLSRHAPPAALAPPGGSVVHVMRYLRAGEPRGAAEGRAELEEHARLAGIDPGGAGKARYLHRQVACPAIPTPSGGGLAGRPGVATGTDGVLVAGDWVGPVGHLTDAALVSGEAAGRRAAEREPATARAGAASGA